MVRLRSLFLAGLPLAPPAYIIWTSLGHPDFMDETGIQVATSCFLGVCGFFLTSFLIPKISAKMPGILTGKDLCKRGTPQGEIAIPESQGIVSGTVCLICIILAQTVYGETAAELARYNAALLSICLMLLLGFIDDVIDLAWRYKLLLPPVAALPLLCIYDGLTSIVLPKPIRFLFLPGGSLHSVAEMLFDVDDNSGGAILDLGIFYKAYMLALAVFCTNSINIYAGINGLEAGQAYIIACAVATQNLIEISRSYDSEHYHQFSLMIMVPFIGTTLSLLKYNWYPSRIFVGDTFCYFAGMTLAVAAILGHFSKTMLFFFLPQVINFVYSTPQLFKIVPCPRHRLPRFNPKTKLLEPSRVPETGRANLTLPNLVLEIFGPMHEQTLCIILMALQAGCCAAAFVVRYHFLSYLY